MCCELNCPANRLAKQNESKIVHMQIQIESIDTYSLPTENQQQYQQQHTHKKKNLSSCTKL